MHDRELDELLARQVQPTGAGVQAAVSELVTMTRAEVVSTRQPLRRRRLVVGGVVLGAVVLTGGGTLTAFQLNLPPFQTLEPGIQRVQQPIAVDYVIVTGKSVQCEAFLEFKNLDERQMDDARAYVASRDWSGFGQQTYNTAKRTAGSSTPDAIDEAFQVVMENKMEAVAERAVPGAVHKMNTGGPEISGWSMYCPTGQR